MLESINMLGSSLFNKGLHQQAIVCLDFLNHILPNNKLVLNILGAAYRNINELEKAVDYLEQAINLSPDGPDALANIGQILLQKGEFKKAETYLTKAISIKNDHINAIQDLISINKMEKNDPLFDQLEKMKTRKDILPADRITLFFTMGKMYHQIKDYDKAFSNYEMANTLRGELIGKNYPIENHMQWTDRVINTITKDFVLTHQGYGEPSSSPVFVLGMPRSGTSLVEQILSSHSMIYGAGELNYLKQFIEQLSKDGKQPWEMLTKENLNMMAEKYLQLTGQISDGSPYVIDKFPQNFLFLWLIAILFPNASIIHVKRNPLDTCLSIFFQDFTKGHVYKNRLDCLGLYTGSSQSVWRFQI